METLKYLARLLFVVVYTPLSLAFAVALHTWYFYLLRPYDWASLLNFLLLQPSVIFISYIVREFVLRRPLQRIIDVDERAGYSFVEILFNPMMLIACIYYILGAIAWVLGFMFCLDKYTAMGEGQITVPMYIMVWLYECILCPYVLLGSIGDLKPSKTQETSPWKDFKKLHSRIFKAIQDCSNGE